MNYILLNKSIYIYVYILLVILATRLFQYKISNKINFDDTD